MMDLCFYILLYMSILWRQKKYIKSEKSAIVYSDVCESRALASILLYFKR